MKKYICIHGHFYQPPRENAWSGNIEAQPTAAPYHDWNERIADECYTPNAFARVLNDEDFIKKIVNNYEKISFNFGPTLLSWMKDHVPKTYQAIQEADRKSLEYFEGHGNAIAQVYNHLIMPLANSKDKRTQIKWGIADFISHFRRMPEGMWLAETAVDLESLRIAAQEGIQFVILGPNQAKSIRRSGSSTWEEVNSDTINTRRAYSIHLGENQKITAFFYDGYISKDVAFNRLLNSGPAYAHRLIQAFDAHDKEVQLVHTATDGETFGHHHKYGEMALASCLDEIEEQENIEIINYGRFMAINPPVYEAKLHENSSWSCVHGIERWRSDCGCKTGGEAHWTQIWRKPLRELLNEFQVIFIQLFENKSPITISESWKLRDAYILYLLNHHELTFDQFLKEQGIKGLTSAEKTGLHTLLKIQHFAMLMYTSCAWFFNEVSDIETLQVVQYLHRGVELATPFTEADLKTQLKEGLKKIPSNKYPNAFEAYRSKFLEVKFRSELLPLISNTETEIDHFRTFKRDMAYWAVHLPYHQELNLKMDRYIDELMNVFLKNGSESLGDKIFFVLKLARTVLSNCHFILSQNTYFFNKEAFHEPQRTILGELLGFETVY